MKLKQAVRRVRRYVEAFELALDYDPIADITLRVQQLEREVTHLNTARSK